jgi:aarF domain-containing kinase
MGSLTAATLIAPPSSATVLAQEPEQEEDRTAAITVEQQMLEESERQRKEARSVPENLGTTRKIVHISHVFILDYIVEPVATGVRFITLVFIFSPVILTMPIVYFGMRLSHKSRVRKGTLWWYGFLTRSLERAGPAFIKV